MNASKIIPLKLLIMALLLPAAFAVNAQQLAFPGAEGFGKYVTGGRNGSVYHVTNLNDSGRGSFRDAVSQPNRIVVFDVGGVIHISDRIVISKNITIAGQTAPGNGITIYGNGIALTSSSGNNIIQYIRFRMGKNGDSGKDAVGISGGKDYLFSHVSISWGRDGTLDVNGSGIDNLTFQDCIVGQGINNQNHSTGGLMQSGKWSIIRSLYIDNKTRNPKARGSHEFINSVLYNWGTNGFIMGDTGGDSYCNMMGNYFICGPSGSSSNYFTGSTPTYRVYGSDNWQDGNKDGILNGSELVPGNGDYKTATVVSTPYNYPGVNTLLPAHDALQYVMEHVGASLARDEVDAFLIEQVQSFGTEGRIINTEDDNRIKDAVGMVYNGPKPADTDGDGMPDDWEDANGTDKAVDDAMVLHANGYVNIENYIHSISEAYPFLNYPLNVRSTSSSKNSIGLAWTLDESNADKLVVVYGKTEGNLDQTVEIAGDATSTLVEGLESGTTYYFSIKAVGADAESAFTEEIAAQTQFAAVPPVPSSQPAPAHNSTLRVLNNVLLAWENTTPSLGGTLLFDVAFGTSPDQLQKVATGSREYTINVGDLLPSTTYYWQVAATNDLGSSDGEIWAFTTSDAPLEMLLYCPFDEESGEVAINVSGTQDAVAVGFTPSWSPGYRNNALFLRSSASNYRMAVPHYRDLLFNRNAFSISLWFKSSGSLPDSYLLHKGTHASSSGGTGKWMGIQYKNSILTFGVDDNSTKSTADVDASQWFDNQWHHLACVRNIASRRLLVYMDGEKIAEATDNTGSIGETDDLIIGNRNTNFDNPYPGSLDELIIYNDALTDDEVRYLYYATPTAIETVTGVKKEVRVYPNPFLQQLIVEQLSNNTRYVVEVFALTGKRWFATQFVASQGTFVINGLDGLPEGMYICRVSSNKEQYSFKLLKK